MKQGWFVRETKRGLGRFAVVVGVACLVVSGVRPGAVRAADWPTYRADHARSGMSAEQISPDLSLRWTFKPTHPPKPAWPRPAEERHRMDFDRAYYVTSSNGLVYFGSSVDNRVYALDSATGKTRWTFATGGPVRFAPTIWRGRVYVGSDDGYVYCLGARDGKVAWKYRPGPSDQKIIGNERMISVWPIRTSVLVDDGVVYFAAGVFPYEGIYVCAVKADDGSVVWKNDTFGDKSHELTFGGITPQGYLVASDSILYVPAGRAMPVAFDRKTGRFRYICSAGGKTGGSWALLAGKELIAGVDHSGTPAKIAYDERTGKRKGDAFAWGPGIDMVVAPKVTYALTDKGIYAIDRASYTAITNEVRDLEKQKGRNANLLSRKKKDLRKAKDEKRKQIEKQIEQLTKKLQSLDAKIEEAKSTPPKWRHVDKDLCSVILAGKVTFAGGQDVVTAFDADGGTVLWTGEVDGAAHGLAVADGNLYVSTDRGTIHCFGRKGPGKPKVVEATIDPAPYPKDKLTGAYEAAAKRIVDETGVTKGYCLVLGCGEGRLAFELAKRTQLKIIGLEPDPKKVAQARKRLDAAGILGVRAVVEPWDIATLPDYFANLIVSDEVLTTGKVSCPPKEVYRVLRPCGGVVYFGWAKAMLGPPKQVELARLVDYVRKTGLTKALVSESKDTGFWVKGVRGKLAGAGGWTQQYGGPHNTACSDDQLIKAPLGVLWFGKPGPETMVERHARAQAPLAINGRLFIQGEEVITAVDAYNGTMLWKRRIPGAVRVRVDVDGGNLALNEDALYVAAEDKCYRLDPATGKVVRVFELPPSPEGQPRRWGYVSCTDKVVFGSAAMPLKQEYGEIWKALVEDGKWKDPDEIPPQFTAGLSEMSPRLAAALRGFRARYPVPDKLARANMQRSGMLWRLIADFPSWGSEKSPKGAATGRMMVSDSVFAVDPATGKHLWVHRGKKIPQISITVADGTVYFVDNAVSKAQRADAIEEKQGLIKKGIHEVGDEAKLGAGIEDVRMLIALDAATGKKRWAKPLDLTGCGGDKLGTAYQDGLLLFFGHFSNHDRGPFNGNQLRWRRITTVDAKTGDVVWSKPLNYLRRPVVVGDTIIIEPRLCELRTGKIKMRPHPMTGEQVPYEFLRPGHSCGITSAAPNCFFYRSYCGAIYDLKTDAGLALFGGIRPGCWLNQISANGLLMMPEASSGCTCSFPLRCSVVMKPRTRNKPKPWTVFITNGSQTPVKRLCLNLGAPADRRDEAGNLWFGYPRPRIQYGVKFKPLTEKLLAGMGYFCRDFRGATIEGTDKPWLFTSGCLGLLKYELPLLDDIWSDGAGRYTVRLGFAAPAGDMVGQRVFDIKVLGKMVLKDFDVVKAAGGQNKAVVKAFRGIHVAGALPIELVPKTPSPTALKAPVINFIEIVREDAAGVAEAPGAGKPIPEAKAKALLASAKAKLDQKQHDEALRMYHALFDGATTVALQRAGLDGMAAIGSTASLSRIARYCRNVAPILRNYQDQPAELRAGSTTVFVAIANNLAGKNKRKAVRMLTYALKIAHGLAARQGVVGGLDKLGVQVDAVPAKQGYVSRWHLIGPFPWEGKTHPMDQTFVSEPNVDLSGSHAVGGKTLKWERYVSERPMVDLEALYGAARGLAIYAYAQVVLDGDKDLLLKVGSDDGFKCWFNGQPVGRFDDGRAWGPDQDVLKVRGKKGANAILLKINNLGAEWGFSARLTDRKDRPAKFGSK